MNITIKNNSNQESVYASMFGMDHNSDWCIYNFSSSTLVKCVTGDTIAKDYLISLGDTLTIKNAPTLSSGIILFTYNELPNDFAVVADAYGRATVQSPSFLEGTSDYNTIFNVIEFTLSGSMFVDITNVDYFSTPVELHLQGKNNDGKVYNESKGKMNASRSKVFSDFKKETKGTKFSNLCVTNNGVDIRILGPQHGVDSGIMPTDYFDSYVDLCWNKYSAETLTIITDVQDYTGKVGLDGKLTVKGSKTGDEYTYSKPGPKLASDIFGCAGVLAAPNNEYGAIAARIGAAINRSILLDKPIQPDCNPHDFYLLTGSTNLYASILHKFYDDGTTYAFPFDDVCSGSSTLSCQIPDELTITLGIF